MLKGSGSVGVAHTHTHAHPRAPQCNGDSGALVDDAPDAHKNRTRPDLREAASSGSRQYSLGMIGPLVAGSNTKDD